MKAVSLIGYMFVASYSDILKIGIVATPLLTVVYESSDTLGYDICI